MNVRKLLGRLNPKAPRYEGGRGGTPEYTPEEIAGALGMVDDVIGREIFCTAWWPDGARLTQKDLQDGLRTLLFEEFSTRYRELSAAKLEMHLLEDASTEEAKRVRSKSKSNLERAQERAWPRNLEKFTEIADAVVHEICAPKICKTCGGRGEIKTDTVPIVCGTCSGLGMHGASGTWRANQLRVSESAYRKYWKPVYEWLYERAAGRESRAARQIADALGVWSEAA